MPKPEKNLALLRRIRTRFDYARREWSEIYKQGGIDVRFVAGDPWDSDDVKAREVDGNKRPHMVFDEASQYVNGYCGQARQQRRTGKVEPGSGADLETAEILQERLYEIDYSSRSAAHKMKALKDAVTRSYGWIGVGCRYSGSKGREQEPYIRGFANPNSVLMDPDCKEYDCSDAMYCFVHEKWPKDRIKSKHKDASDLGEEGETILLMVYYEVELDVVDKVLSFDSEEQPDVLESQLPEGFDQKSAVLIDERDVVSKRIKKYIVQMRDNFSSGFLDSAKRFVFGDNVESNVEVLDVEDWDDNKDGEEDPQLVCIPIVGVFGEEYFVGDGNAENPGEAKRTLLSMIRRARGPMQALNLTVSTQAELAALIPKTRYLGYEGQFEGHEDEFANVGSSPLAYLQVKALIDPANKSIMPLPRKENWEPPIQNLEVFAQSLRNAIRAAVGQIASPELDKAKSGIALKRLQESGAASSFSFTDNFDMSLEQLYRVVVRQIRKTHDTAREIAVRNKLGERRLVKINQPWTDEEGKSHNYDFSKGEFACTISTGPSYQSQFDATSDFIDNLASSDPQMLMLFGDILVKMKNLGPEADPLIERFKLMLPPQLQQQGKQGQISPQAIMQAQQAINQLTQQLSLMTQERDSKKLELDSKEKIAASSDEVKKFSEIVKLRIAEIDAMTKGILTHEQLTSEENLALQAQQAQQQIADLSHQQNLEANEIQHEQSLESGDVSHQQTMEQAEQQAALNPPVPASEESTA